MFSSEFRVMAAGLALTLGLAACSAPQTEELRPLGADIVDDRRQNDGELVVYAQNWDSAQVCNELMQDELTERPTRITVGFSGFLTDGTVSAPVLNPACVKMITHIGSEANISLGIGGWGSDDGEMTHADVLEATAAAMQNPEAFTQSTVRAVRDLSETLGTPVTGVTLDFEDLGTLAAQKPGLDVGAGYNGLVTSLREDLPNAKLSLAIQAGGLDFSLDPSIDKVDAVEVMAYDYEGPWSPTTGDIAPESWVVSAVRKFSATMPANKIVVGYPAYGYRYPGTQNEGEVFDPAQAELTLLRDIPEDLVEGIEPAADGNEAIVDGAWTSFVSPQQMRRTQNQLTQELPGLGGAMVWSLEGATADVYNSLG